MYFVGDRSRTINEILRVLRGACNRHLHFINELLNNLTSEGSTTTPIYRHPTVFRPKDAPVTSVPAVYLIVSVAHPEYSYIGETGNLLRRINEHNTGKGPEVTSSVILRPFAIHAYVIGFTERSERLRFESLWKLTARRQSHLASSTGDGLVEVGRRLVEQENTKQPTNPRLRIVQCGYMEQNTSVDRDPEA